MDKYNESRQNAENLNNRTLDLIIVKFKTKIKKEIKHTYKAAIENYNENEDIDNDIYINHRINIEALLVDLYNKALRAGQERLLSTFLNVGWIKKGQISLIKSLNDLEFKQYIINRVKIASDSIVNTTKKEIEALIQQGLEAQEKNAFLENVMSALIEQAGDRSIFRSLVIGLSSAHNAMMFGQTTALNRAANNEYDYYKIWITEKDEKVREDHVKMEGVAVLKDDYFIVGGVRMFDPGDDSGGDATIKQWIKCRCFLRYRRVRR